MPFCGASQLSSTLSFLHTEFHTAANHSLDYWNAGSILSPCPLRQHNRVGPLVVWMAIRIRVKTAQRKKLAWPLLSLQPLLAVRTLGGKRGRVASPVKAVSRRRRGPQARLYRVCRPAILGHRGRRLTTTTLLPSPSLRGFTPPVTSRPPPSAHRPWRGYLRLWNALCICGCGAIQRSSLQHRQATLFSSSLFSIAGYAAPCRAIATLRRVPAAYLDFDQPITPRMTPDLTRSRVP